jgi:hypothetical protein
MTGGIEGHRTPPLETRQSWEIRGPFQNRKSRYYNSLVRGISIAIEGSRIVLRHYVG